MAERIRAASRGVLVTGTDTGVGKTVVSSALLHALGGHGYRAVGIKPVASGAVRSGSRLVNEDVEALVAAANVQAPQHLVNPYCFAPAIAPHLAAELAGHTISLPRLRSAYEGLCSRADRVVVEGAGGLLVPLNRRRDFGHLAQYLDVPVVLVVGMRLGCLNHALLTAEVLRWRGLRFAGWVANRVEPAMARFGRNLEELRSRLDAPLLGVVPHGRTAPAAVARALRLPRELR
jgi:dethiobiotin synthetase